MRYLIVGAAGALLLVGGCATPGQLPQRVQLAVTMTGVQEVPGPGDPAMTGHGQFRIDTRSGEVCWDVYARGGAAATAAEVRRGAAGIVGPVAVQLTPPDADGHSQGCTTLDAGAVRALAFQPYNYYVNVASAAFPNGAIRGQLRGDGPFRQDRRARDNEPESARLATSATLQ